MRQVKKKKKKRMLLLLLLLMMMMMKMVMSRGCHEDEDSLSWRKKSTKK
jgi:hypothetical protein